MDQITSSEEELINGCIRRERKYQEMLYKRFSGKMYGVCMSYCKDEDEAKDVLQEGFIKVFGNIHTYNHKAPLDAWIRKIMVNTSIDSYRRQIRLVSINVRIDDSYIDPVEAHVLSKIATDDLLRIIEELPHGCKMIFNLFAIDGYSHKEIADKLNISEGTSKSQFSRARKLLQEKIMQYYDLEKITDTDVRGILQMV